MAIVKNILSMISEEGENARRLDSIANEREVYTERLAVLSAEAQEISAKQKELKSPDGIAADMAEFEKFADVPIALTEAAILKKLPQANVKIGIDPRFTLGGIDNDQAKYSPLIKVSFDNMTIELKSLTQNNSTADSIKGYLRDSNEMVRDNVTARFVDNYFNHYFSASHISRGQMLSGEYKKQRVSEYRKLITSFDKDGSHKDYEFHSRVFNDKLWNLENMIKEALFEAADKWAEQNKNKQLTQGENSTGARKKYKVVRTIRTKPRQQDIGNVAPSV